MRWIGHVLLTIALLHSLDIRAEETSFTFGAAGDFGQPSQMEWTINSIATRKPAFFIALGDLSYGGMGSEKAWAEYVRGKLGNTYPFEVLTGNHEDEKGADGRINNFVKYLPSHLPIKGDYGTEYYVDYPSRDPLARIILISPDIYLDSSRPRTYERDTEAFKKLHAWIHSAREKGIPWIIVGSHKTCISATNTHFSRHWPSECEMGKDLFQYLVAEQKVDLILHAHEHSYQRSLQLKCNPMIGGERCIWDQSRATYREGRYEKGAGTVVAVVGTGGRVIADRKDKQLYAYFPGYDPSNGWSGYLSITISDKQLLGQTIFSGNKQDRFLILGR